jgi:DNA-binding MarR family transcriptional regulator
VRVVAKIERRIETYPEQYGLTPPQFEVLNQLQRTLHIVQQQLADRLRMSKGNVVGIFHRLVQAGFVLRQIHPEDGRAYLVCLTGRPESDHPHRLSTSSLIHDRKLSIEQI